MDDLQKTFIKEFINKKNILQYAVYTSSNFAIFNINSVVIRLKEVVECARGYCLHYMLFYAYMGNCQTEEIKVYNDNQFYDKLQKIYQNYLFKFIDKREIKYIDLINKIKD